VSAEQPDHAVTGDHRGHRSDLAALDDHALARELAVAAGAVLLELRDAGAGLSPWRLMDEGDRRSHVFLVQALAEARPDDLVLSEEGRDAPKARAAAERVWIVDPLDGTNEFGEWGRPDWAVHVALWERGRLSAAAVALPAQGQVYGTDPRPALPPMPADRPPRIVVSRNRVPYAAMLAAKAIGAEFVRLGSAGAKAMCILQGHADAYLHAGGMYEWDVAAPAGVAWAAGLHASRLDGAPLVFNRSDPWSPDLVICRPEYAEAILTAIA
jgi:3'(2'), 5'-bisphosphate nucleotidase